MQEVYDRTNGKGAMLLTSDAYPAYATAIEEVYGEWVQPERNPGPSRPPGPHLELPAGLVYATVCKKREGTSGGGDKVGGVRDVVPAGLLATAVEGEQHHQHVVRGAQQCDG